MEQCRVGKKEHKWVVDVEPCSGKEDVAARPSRDEQGERVGWTEHWHISGRDYEGKVIEETMISAHYVYCRLCGSVPVQKEVVR